MLLNVNAGTGKRSGQDCVCSVSVHEVGTGRGTMPDDVFQTGGRSTYTLVYLT